MRFRPPVLPLSLALAAGGPLLASLWWAMRGGNDTQAWARLAQDPTVLPALRSSLLTGMGSTVLALALSAVLMGYLWQSRHGARARAWLAPLLAVPHAAFAIATVMILAPSGWLLRLFSPWATGWDAPPGWPTAQDPWGFGLTLVLVAKEVPFLLWAISAHLARSDVGPRLRREARVALSLGYSPRQAWWRVVWPQLLPRVTWPVLAVLVYGWTVVDVAWIAGPTNPPTLAVLAWQWLLDADPAFQAQGAAVAWLLTLLVAASGALLWAVLRAPWWGRLRVSGRDPLPVPATQVRGAPLWGGLLALYGGVVLALAIGSFLGDWPFPHLLPSRWSLNAWQSVLAQGGTLFTTAWLALAAATAALLWTMAWLEWAPARWQRLLAPLWAMPLALPAVLWVPGLHRTLIGWHIDASTTGVWLAHTLCVLPYTLLVLQAPYQAVDPRLGHVAAALGRSRMAYLLQVKWPLLRAPLLAALAVGFAVSVAQYIPTLYIGAGRLSTITTEAVAQASGGQRALASAFAALQCLLPWSVFLLSAWLSRPRHSVLRPAAIAD